MKKLIAVPELEYNSCKGCIGSNVGQIGCTGAKKLYSEEIYSCSDNSTIFIEKKEEDLVLCVEDTKVKTKEEELKELEAKVAKLKSEIENGSKELFLSVSSLGSLVVRYGNRHNYIGLFYIDRDGEMHFTLTRSTLKLYNEWVRNGMKVNNSMVSWKGKDYFIDTDDILQNDDEDLLFDFEYLRPAPDCADENIIRTEKEKIPVIFS